MGQKVWVRARPSYQAVRLPFPRPTFTFLRPSMGVDWVAGKGPASPEGHCYLA